MPKGGSHPLMHRLAAPLRCSLVLSLREKEQSTIRACSIRTAGNHQPAASNCRSAGISPLRRRPKGFPVALWKPSVPSGWRKGISDKSSLFHQGSRHSPCLQHHRCRNARIPPLRRRPKGFPVALWEPSASPVGGKEQVTRAACFIRAAGNHQPAASNCRNAGISPLRRRPKGFPVALWKPSAPPVGGEESSTLPICRGCPAIKSQSSGSCIALQLTKTKPPSGC